jgi:adenylate cyclase
MEAPPVQRRLAAILAADVEGYSRLMHSDEEATMAKLSARRAFVDELIARQVSAGVGSMPTLRRLLAVLP